MLTLEQTTRLIDQILAMRQYRGLGIPRETIEDLIQHEAEADQHERTVLKKVHRKMHHLVADYLGDIDYEQAEKWLEEAYSAPDNGLIKETCTRIMTCHASTRERLPHLENFYHTIFAACGMPKSILDLACGLNPFALPWMNLPLATQYHAYDINTPRIKLINRFFQLEQKPTTGEVKDVLVDPPERSADLAFFFKEAHRMEQRRKGANRELWQALKVRTLVVSLPAASLSGQHNLSQQMRRLVDTTLSGLPWKVKVLLSGNEIIFCIQK